MQSMVQYAMENGIFRAHRSPAEGQSGQAATALSQLAAGIDGRGRPRQAGNLHAKAAHAFIEAGDARQALEQARLVLGISSASWHAARAAQFKARIVQHLQEKGKTSEDIFRKSK